MKQLITHLSEFVLPERLNRLTEVLNNRTRYATVVLENIYHTQNASAVIRTADCFGLQDIHVIENEHEFDINPDVVLGATKWVDLHRYNKKQDNSAETLSKLKKEGYRIVATSPHLKSTALQDFDVSKGKFALVFGTEKHGISETVKEMADEFLYIPMYGFTESFNISVTAAMCMHHLTEKVRREVPEWSLSAQEKDEVYLSWLRKTIKNVELIEKQYFERVLEKER